MLAFLFLRPSLIVLSFPSPFPSPFSFTTSLASPPSPPAPLLPPYSPYLPIFLDILSPLLPPTEQVLDLLHYQLSKVASTRIDAIILVGGFAASEYLFTRVQEAFGATIAVIARPNDCDVATLRGAARYGLGLTQGKKAVSNVISPRSYIMSELSLYLCS